MSATHVASCQAAIDSFQAHHLKILNVDATALPAPTPHEEPQARAEATPMPRMKVPVNLDDELGKLRAMAPSAADGRR